MKYVELKAQLKTKIASAYLVYGDDRYLCYDALKKIEDALGIAIKDMNSVVLSGESLNAKDIVASANMYPFGDQYRLVVVKNYSPVKNKDEAKEIQNYLSQPLQSTVLLFFNPEGSDFFKGMTGIEMVDCSKIDSKFISAYVKNILSKEDIQSNETAIEKLIMFCGNDMTRVTSELEKLKAYTAETKVLTEAVVEEFVVQDKEYQVYQLAEFIAKNDKRQAIDLVEKFTMKPGSAFMILTPLQNNYRRVLFAALNKDKTTAELANMLGCKEFAIKMLKNQIAAFSPKQLKEIVDMTTEYDKKIKLGEMKENVAIKTLVFNILTTRGKNDK